jgi:hypothetical protein
MDGGFALERLTCTQQRHGPARTAVRHGSQTRRRETNSPLHVRRSPGSARSGSPASRPRLAPVSDPIR